MQNQNYLTVTQFVDITDNALKRFGRAVILGEISELSRYSHLYFKIKDENACLDCLMFASVLNSLPFTPKVGQRVFVGGVSSVYKKNGSFKFIVDQMIASGEGIIMERLRLLKEKLHKEGVFDQSKRKLPEIINTVGIITSSEGRVVHDIIRTLRQRNSVINIKIYSASVQGAEAPSSLIKAIKTANSQKLCDVLIIGRGGGSVEDLLPFSDEDLVREIAASGIITISAVGHEPDVALSDFAADVRAATPTAAAVMVSAITDDIILNRLESIANTLTQGMLRHIDYMCMRLDNIASRLKASNPVPRLQLLNSGFESIMLRMGHSMDILIRDSCYCLDKAQTQLNSVTLKYIDSTLGRVERSLGVLASKDFMSQLKVYENTVDSINVRMDRAVDDIILKLQLRLTHSIENLEVLNPLNTLKRGFAIAQDESGRILKSKNVDEGDNIQLRLSDGILKAQVTSVSVFDGRAELTAHICDFETKI